MPSVIGLDIGTSGVRALLVEEDGKTLASASAPLPASDAPRDGWAEQRAQDWWQAVIEVLHELTVHARNGEGDSGLPIAGIAVDSTSGTIVPVDADGNALAPALMYNDSRAAEEAAVLNDAGADLLETMGYRFNSGFHHFGL